MARYFAEVDDDSTVLRVVVCDDPEWLSARLGGVWVETADPYAEPETVAYPGPGHGCDETFPERFAEPWVPPVPDPETGEWPLAEGGELRFHAGRIWRNLCPAGIPNVWEPPINWRDVPLVGLPEWRQPTSAEDAYNIADPVMHLGVGWKSKINANTTEPGSDDRWWELIDPLDVEPTDPDPGVAEWSEGVAYAVGDLRSYAGVVYRCISAHTAWVGAGWTPPISPSLWEPA